MRSWHPHTSLALPHIHQLRHLPVAAGDGTQKHVRHRAIVSCIIGSSMNDIRKVVIPVAGYGTRFCRPGSHTQEMMPVLDKPTIQYVVEESRVLGHHGSDTVTGASSAPWKITLTTTTSCKIGSSRAGDLSADEGCRGPWPTLPTSAKRARISNGTPSVECRACCGERTVCRGLWRRFSPADPAAQTQL